MVLIYALIAARGFKIALLADDGFSKLLATGLTAVFALQAFVIIGGVTRVIPLTGVTLPFVSYGGSSIVANFILLALLLMISDRVATQGRGSSRRLARVNRQIVKLFGLILLLFALLFGFTSYWSVFDASSLKANTANRRPLLEQQKIKRGDIVAADGTVIAHSTPVGQGQQQDLRPPLPGGRAVRQPDRLQLRRPGRVGFELSHNDELVGNKTEFLSILDELQGHAQVGDNVQSSLDPTAQRAAVNGLAGRRGAVVAMVPSTGEIKAMVSIPEYDPNSVQNSRTFQRLNTDNSAPLFNRATQAGYPPGSTMKVVTATAALDSGQFTPSSVLSGRSPQTIDGVPLSNAGGEQFGDIDMTTALTNSVNTWWAQVGEKIGKDTMFKYMDRYGFDSKPRLDLPAFQLAASGVYSTGTGCSGPSDPIDIGRVAIGQERLRVTPLQMAEVAATVANKGELMEPQAVVEGGRPRRARDESLARLTRAA